MRERKIKNSENPFAGLDPHANLILKNIDEVIYYVSFSKKANQISFLTDRIEDILGISKKKYLQLGKKVLDLCHPDDVPDILKRTNQLLKKKQKGTFRYRFYNRRKKAYIWIEETIYPQLDKKKKLTGYFGVSRNIEHEKRYEQQIIESEKKFRLLAENSSDIIFHYQFRPKPGYTYVSPSVKRILGYQPEEFYKDALIGFKIIHPADRDLLLNSQQNVIKGRSIKKTFTKLAARYLTKKGEVVWLENRYSPLYKGKEIVALHCISRDITEQKLKEEELHGSRAQLSNIMANLPGMAYRCLHDEHWTMKFISSGSLALTGYKPEELIDNKKKSFASIIHPEDRLLGKKEIKAALKKREAFEIEYRIIDKSGKTKWIWEKGIGVYDKKKLLYIEGFINDISARKTAEQELNQKWLDYKNLVDAIPIGVIIHLNGRILLGNKAAFDIMEVSPNKSHDKISLLDFLSPQNRKIATERIKRAMAGEYTPPFEYEALSKKGSMKIVRVNASPILFHGTPALQITLQDLTTEKQLENERLKARMAVQVNQELKQEIDRRVESEQKLKAIFESTSHLIWTLNKDLEIVSYNKQYADAVKNLCGTILKPGIKATAFKWAFAEEDYKLLRAAHTSAFQGKDSKVEIPLHAIDGKLYYREMHFHPININGTINEIAAVAQDTTERRNYEKQIIEQSARLRAIFKSGSQLMWTVNNELQLTSFNKNYADAIYEMYGTYPELNTDIKRLPKKLRSEEYNEFWSGKYEEALKGKSLEFDTERTTLAGKKIYRHIFLHPIYNEKNEVVEVSAVGYDITSQKRAQDEILNKQSQLEAIINTTDDIIFSIDKDYRLVEFNEVLKRIVKERSGKEIRQGVLVNDILPPAQRAELIAVYKRVLGGESITAIETFMVGGEERLYEAHYNPIKTNNNITGIAVFSRDITEQKRHEENTLKSLKEKEILLKEVHHRVKNNLQVISSILSLQTAYLKDRSTINLLKECQNRIKTMAFIHESLYQNKDFSQINFTEYIITLVKNLFYSFETNQQKIKTNFAVDTIFLNLDLSIPCGLIINELVSNALKYAFDDGRDGTVFITLKKDKGKIRMIVADNGKGIPPEVDYRSTETLGLQLVTTLTEQINGTITMNRNKGTTFEIIF
jgi:PAS domain S-box-containing protein